MNTATRTTYPTVSDNRVLVRPRKVEDMTPGGIALPESTNLNQSEGEILSVGFGRSPISGDIYSMGLKPGDEIVYTPQHAFKVNVNGEDLIVLQEEAVLLVTNR